MDPVKLRLTLNGAAPLLMHSKNGIDPTHPTARKMKEITSKRKKTDDDLEAIARLEFELNMDFRDDIGPYIPGVNIEKSLVVGGRITKAGKLVERAIIVWDLEVPVQYDGPRTIQELWDHKDRSGTYAFRSKMPVKVGMSRVMRCRPIFNTPWALTAEMQLDTSILGLREFESIVEMAGQSACLGDYRPRYGRYIGSVEEL